VRYIPEFGDVPKVVAALAAPGDLVLTMGAGDITRMGPLVLAEIAGTAPAPGSPGTGRP
jgi:UDP-N-acetylmuramate--alanine ligase